MPGQPIKCEKGGYCQSKGNGSLICKKCNKNEYKPYKKKAICTEKIKQTKQV